MFLSVSFEKVYSLEELAKELLGQNIDICIVHRYWLCLSIRFVRASEQNAQRKTRVRALRAHCRVSTCLHLKKKENAVTVWQSAAAPDDGSARLLRPYRGKQEQRVPARVQA